MKASIWCATVAALGLLAGSGPGSAATTRGMAGLDLRLRPGDVVLPPPEAPAIEPALPAPSAQSVSEVVGEVDRVTEPETPNRHAADTGPLGELVGDGLLKELLENKTIPLFRIRVEPPFRPWARRGGAREGRHQPAPSA